MGTTTPYGIPYPEPGGHTRTWEHWQDQAEAVNDLLPKFIQAGTVVVTIASANATGSTAVVFDTPFASDPVVVIGVQTGTSASTGNVCWASSISPTGFTAYNSRGNTTPTTLQWVAIGVPA